jgi:nitrite reductase/ring-hydroxylating ferredoxin subunit
MHPLQIWPHPLRIGRITKTNIANHEADPRKKIAVAIDREGEHRTIDTQCMHTLRLRYRAIAWLSVGLVCPHKGAFHAYGYTLYVYIRSRCITEHYIRR